jgi:hypothetical protein
VLEAVGMGLIVAALAILTARGLRNSRQTRLAEPAVEVQRAGASQ